MPVEDTTFSRIRKGEKEMKTIIIILLFSTMLTAQIYQETGRNVTRTCIVCGQEWSEWVASSGQTIWGTTTYGTGLNFYNQPREENFNSILV